MYPSLAIDNIYASTPTHISKPCSQCEWIWRRLAGEDKQWAHEDREPVTQIIIALNWDPESSLPLLPHELNAFCNRQKLIPVVYKAQSLWSFIIAAKPNEIKHSVSLLLNFGMFCFGLGFGFATDL